MDAQQGRRLAALLLLCGCFLITTWLETLCNLGDIVVSGGRTKRSTVVGPELRDLLKDGRVKSDTQFEMARQKLLLQYEDSAHVQGPEGKPPSKKNSWGGLLAMKTPSEGSEGEDNEISKDNLLSPFELITSHYEEIEEAFLTAIEERAKDIRRKVYKCLPKFICEVHSQGPEKVTTDLEREWLNLYSSPGLLPESTQLFQTAAHMGQLFRGYQPSPCHQLYTNCPITMKQLKKFLAVGDFKKARYW